VLKWGDIFVDGSKVEANASKHKARSGAYANQLEAHLKAEVEKLLELAESADGQDPRGAGYPSGDGPARRAAEEDR
jgi:hypothetical protein